MKLYGHLHSGGIPNPEVKLFFWASIFAHSVAGLSAMVGGAIILHFKVRALHEPSDRLRQAIFLVCRTG